MEEDEDVSLATQEDVDAFGVPKSMTNFPEQNLFAELQAAGWTWKTGGKLHPLANFLYFKPKCCRIGSHELEYNWYIKEDDLDIYVKLAIEARKKENASEYHRNQFEMHVQKESSSRTRSARGRSISPQKTTTATITSVTTTRKKKKTENSVASSSNTHVSTKKEKGKKQQKSSDVMKERVEINKRRKRSSTKSTKYSDYTTNLESQTLDGFLDPDEMQQQSESENTSSDEDDHNGEAVRKKYSKDRSKKSRTSVTNPSRHEKNSKRGREDESIIFAGIRFFFCGFVNEIEEKNLKSQIARNGGQCPANTHENDLAAFLSETYNQKPHSSLDAKYPNRSKSKHSKDRDYEIPDEVVLLTAPTQYRKARFLLGAVSPLVTLIHPSWVNECITKGYRVGSDEYSLPAGMPICQPFARLMINGDTGSSIKVTQLNNDDTGLLLQGLKVANLTGISNKDYPWDSILAAAGCEKVRLTSDLRSQIRNCNEKIDGLNVALVDFDCTDADVSPWKKRDDLFTASQRSFFVVTVEWLVQSIISGVRLDFNEHPVFNPFYTSKLKDDNTLLRKSKDNKRYMVGDIVMYGNTTTSTSKVNGGAVTVGKISNFMSDLAKLQWCTTNSGHKRSSTNEITLSRGVNDNTSVHLKVIKGKAVVLKEGQNLLKYAKSEPALFFASSDWISAEAGREASFNKRYGSLDSTESDHESSYQQKEFGGICQSQEY